MRIWYDEYLEVEDNLNAIEWLFCILNLAFDNRFVRVFIITIPQQCNIKCKNYSKCIFVFVEFETKSMSSCVPLGVVLKDEWLVRGTE